LDVDPAKIKILGDGGIPICEQALIGGIGFAYLAIGRWFGCINPTRPTLNDAARTSRS
jgi:hypothetical protein